MLRAERICMHHKIGHVTIEILKWAILETFNYLERLPANDKFKFQTTGHGRTLKMNDFNWFRWFPSMSYHAFQSIL